jgi:hypothetical protein
MDLDGTFLDNDVDGLYEIHYGDVEPEIWLGRLTASPLIMDGADEVSLLQNYFYKNHLYRIGQLGVNPRALSYIDDDWSSSAAIWTDNLGMAYPDRTMVSNGAVTIDSDYEARLPTGYQFIQLCAHSSPYQHHFKIGEEWTGGYTTNAEIKTIDPLALFYNLFACSNARFISYDYMAGWYVFCQDYGLAAVGSTKTGSMLYFNHFYGPFGSGSTIGEALRDWFVAVATSGFSDYETCWHYGMSLIGDPTLRKFDADIAVNPAVLPVGRLGSAYSVTLTAEGNMGPFDWQVTGGDLPTGLTLNQSTGEIYGTPDALGLTEFELTAADNCLPPLTDTENFSIEIIPACGDVEIDGLVNILDVVYIINYLYKNGAEPTPPDNADVDNDTLINILDAVYLINYLYKSGPDPVCD